MRVTRPLVMEVDRREISVGDELAVRVRDRTSGPVAGAVVRLGTQTERTDDDGRCRFTIRSPGLWRLVAFRSPVDRIAYEPASGLVRVVPGAASATHPYRTGSYAV